MEATDTEAFLDGVFPRPIDDDLGEVKYLEPINYVSFPSVFVSIYCYSYFELNIHQLC